MKLEWLILADGAQVVGGKVYVLGGGWNRIFVNQFPTHHVMALAVSVLVDWNETNRKHSLDITIIKETDSEQPVVPPAFKMTGGFEVGRSAGIRPGAPQRAQLAVSGVLQLDGPATYQVTAKVNDQIEHQIAFDVIAGPLLQLQQRAS